MGGGRVNRRGRFRRGAMFIALADVILLNLAALFSYLLRFSGLPPKYNWHPALTIYPLTSLVLIGIFQAYGLYAPRHRDWSEIQSAVLSSMVVTGVSTAALTFLVGGQGFPRSILVMAWLFATLALIGWRKTLYYSQDQGANLERLVVVGPDAEAQRLHEKLERQPHLMVCGMFSSIFDEGAQRLLDLRDEGAIDRVVVLSSTPVEEKARTVSEAMHRRKGVYLVPGPYEIFLVGAAVQQMDDVPVLSVDDMGLSDSALFWKRSVDVLFAGLGALILSPLAAVIALLVLIIDGRPVIFGQERVGRSGQHFILYKFRTMVRGAEDDTGPVLSDDNDPRVTALGRVLRATHLDELPQLYNIIRGDMSWVGPRPERPYFVDQFAQRVDFYEERMRLQSGLTGLAQTRGRYTTEAEDKLRFDLLYAKHYSLWLDLRILLDTFRGFFHSDHATKRG